MSDADSMLDKADTNSALGGFDHDGELPTVVREVSDTSETTSAHLREPPMASGIAGP